MSQKYSTTTADFLVWSDAMNLIRKLAKDNNYKISLLVALGCFTGLRISDILALRWNQILGVSEFTIIEKKTGKKRMLRLNPQLQKHSESSNIGKSERYDFYSSEHKQTAQTN